MKDPKDRAVLKLETVEQAAEVDSEERTVYLRNGRTLAVTSDEVNELVEIRSASGAVELRVKLTEEGPVMQLEGVKLEVKAADSVAVECKTFNVNATESVQLTSDGDLNVEAEGEMLVRSTDEMRIRGKIIWLN